MRLLVAKTMPRCLQTSCLRLVWWWAFRNPARRFSPSPRASTGLGWRARNASEIGLSRAENSPTGPGQNRSSSGRVKARRWALNLLKRSAVFSGRQDGQGRLGADVLVPDCLQKASEPEWLLASVDGWLAASLGGLRRENGTRTPSATRFGSQARSICVMEQRRFVSHAEAARLMRRGGYSQERIDQVLQELPDPFDMDSQHNEAVFLKHGITYGRAMDRMGGSP